MQKATLELKGLTAKHRRSSEQAGCPTIQGRSLLEHFHAFIMSIPESGLKSDESDLYMRVTSVKCAGSSVFVTIESGAFGDDGKVYDVETGAMKYPKAYTDSMTISSRVVMYQPPSAPMAIFAVEKVGDSKGYFLLNSFVAAMKQYDDSYTYQSSNIYEADDWAQVSDLVKINVVAYKKSLSHRAGLEDKPIIANLSQTLTPPKGEHKFEPWIKKKILNRQIDVVELFEVSDSPDKTSEDKESEDKESDSLDKKCTITLEHEGRTKTIELGKVGAPVFREVLTEKGDLPLGDDAFQQRAAELVASRYKCLGLEWSTAYEQSEWSEDSLKFRWNTSQIL